MMNKADLIELMIKKSLYYVKYKRNHNLIFV